MFYPKSLKFSIYTIPVVKDAVDHQPLYLNPKATKVLLHVNKQRIFVFPLGALVIITFAPEVNRWRFIHVGLPLVVTKHHLAVQLQLEGSNESVELFMSDNAYLKENGSNGEMICRQIFYTYEDQYLQLQHPGAVPVGHIAPFDKELPLPTANQRRGVGSVSRQVSRPGDGRGGRRFPPPPC